MKSVVISFIRTMIKKSGGVLDIRDVSWLCVSNPAVIYCCRASSEVFRLLVT